MSDALTACGNNAPRDGKPVDPAFRVVETRYGPMNVVVNNDDLIARFLTEAGEWAFDEAVFVAAALNDGARVLDAGAFLGTFGLGVGLRRQLGLLCAVEANPRILPLLETNLQRNAGSNFEVIGALLAGTEKSSRIGHANPANLGSASFSESAAGESHVPAPEAAITLATLRERLGPFDLIKLDIEGMEREVLLGDAEHLSHGGTTLWIECNDDARSLGVLDLVLSWGLEVHYFAFPSHNPDNFHGLAKPILPWAYEAGLLVAPSRPPELDPQLAAHGCILRCVTSRAELEEAMWLTPRWLPDELAGADAPMLAAVASRALSGQERSTFLRDSRGESVWKRLEAMQEHLAGAERLAVARLAEIEEERRIRISLEELAVSRLAEIEDERRMRTNAETGLAKATSLALARLGLLGPERDRATDAEAAAKVAIANAEAAAKVAVANAEVQLASINAQLAAIKMSLGWRFVARVNMFIERRPRLHRMLRRGRAVAGRLRGRR